MRQIIFLIISTSLVFAQVQNNSNSNDPFKFPQEKRLKNIKMLTNGGENAEAYLSFNEDKLIFQSTRNELDRKSVV